MVGNLGRIAETHPGARAARGDRHRGRDACDRICDRRGSQQRGGRYAARDLIAAVLGPRVARRTLEAVRVCFTVHAVSWGPYQSFGQLVREDPRCSCSVSPTARSATISAEAWPQAFHNRDFDEVAVARPEPSWVLGDGLRAAS